jgi:hypothetical protein
MLDREIAAGTNPEDVFVLGLSQGGSTSATRHLPVFFFASSISYD